MYPYGEKCICKSPITYDYISPLIGHDCKNCGYSIIRGPKCPEQNAEHAAWEKWAKSIIALEEREIRLNCARIDKLKQRYVKENIVRKCINFILRKLSLRSMTY